MFKMMLASRYDFVEGAVSRRTKQLQTYLVVPGMISLQKTIEEALPDDCKYVARSI